MENNDLNLTPSAGLNGERWNEFLDLLIKANNTQLKEMARLVQKEIELRSQKNSDIIIQKKF